MSEDVNREIAAWLAKAMAMICVRNTKLEDFHAGLLPITLTGDFSDVVVVDGEGRRIPWTEISRFNDDEMGALMREVVNRLYTFQLRLGEAEFRAYIDRQLNAARHWDDPALDRNLAGKVLREQEGL
jgi:hypothetical protein